MFALSKYFVLSVEQILCTIFQVIFSVKVFAARYIYNFVVHMQARVARRETFDNNW